MIPKSLTTDYLDACLAGVADFLKLAPSDLRAGADPIAREGRAIAAWFARGQTGVRQCGWDVIAHAYGFAVPGDAIQAVDRIERGQSRLLDSCGMSLAIMARMQGGQLALAGIAPPLKNAAEGDSEAPEPAPACPEGHAPAWSPEEDDCEDADELELPDWLEET